MTNYFRKPINVCKNATIITPLWLYLKPLTIRSDICRFSLGLKLSCMSTIAY